MIKKDVDEFIAEITKEEPHRWRHIIDKLPPHGGYPEAIDDANQLDYLIRYFLPHIMKDLPQYGQELLHSLYNPLNISSLATDIGIACPPGYSVVEMQTRNATTDPCHLCGDPVPRYTSSIRRCKCTAFFDPNH
jgi:hypothetical protein